MNKVLGLFLGAALMSACAGTPTSVIAADEPNLLIMGEDADEDTVPRDSRVFKRVLAAVANQMGDAGFAVYDETAVTLDNFAQGRVRRTDAELIDIAKSITRPPIDVAVIYSIYASAREVGYTTKVKTRIEGRLLNIKTGRRLGNFEVDSPSEWNAPAECSRECILETVGSKSRILANDLGAVLAEKLAFMVEGPSDEIVLDGDDNWEGLETAFAMEFDNFTPDEMEEIEEYLVVFSGYLDHRPTYTGNRRAEFWYETTSKTSRLQRNLKKAMDMLDLRTRITFSGNTYKIEKITTRDRRDRPDPSEW